MPDPIQIVGGTSDDTAEVLHAFADAHAANAPVHLPAGVCRYSSTIVLTKMIPIIGHGRALSILEYTGTGNALEIVPPTDQSGNICHLLRDFGIRPAVLGGGVNGVKVTLGVGAFYAYADWERVNVGQFGSYGVYLDNTAANLDGFFNNTISNSFIGNGLKGVLIGDSVCLRDCVVHGLNNVSLTGVNGARLFQIIGGQITTANGFIDAADMSGVRIENVWMEHASGYPAPAPSVSNVMILRGLENQIIGCTMGVGGGAHNIALVNTSFTKILENSFTNRASSAHIYGTPGTTNTLIRDNHYGTAPVVVLQGS